MHKTRGENIAVFVFSDGKFSSLVYNICY